MPLTDRQFWTRAWLCFFAYAVFASLFIQLILLPHVVPAWHAGHGLMRDHDWVTYHAWGTELARFLRMGDWKSWWNAEAFWIEVRAISIPYAFIAPEPWALVPFNAFFHATGAILLALCFLRTVTTKRKAALIGTLPYVFFPTALLWTSQIHKDGANNFAFSCFLFGWVLVFRMSDWNLKRLFTALFFIAFGMYFSWVIRPYLGSVLIVCSSALLFVGAIAFYRNRNKHFGWSLVSSAITVALLIPTVKVSTYTSIDLANHTETVVATNGEEIQPQVPIVAYEPTVNSNPTTSAQNVTTDALQKAQTETATPLEAPPVKEVKIIKPKTTTVFVDVNRFKAWEKTPHVPDFVEGKAYRIASVRTGFIGMNLGKNNIDDHYYFYKLSDEIRYLPRAIQHAVFAPYPSAWLNSSSAEHNNFFKKIVVVEMLFVYFSMAFFTLFLVKNYRKKEVWVLFLFSFAVLTLFGLTVANLGTLCRFRYFFLMTWVGIGFTYAATLLPEWKRMRISAFTRLKPKTA